MSRLWWIGIGMVVWAAAPGCGGDRLIPRDIERMMATEGGRWALKAMEGHGGIWRWRARPYVAFDYAELTVAYRVDTTITGPRRRRDTTITPRVDTLVHLREHVTLRLDSGWAHTQSAAQDPTVQKGFDGGSVWVVRDTVPSYDSAELAAARVHLERLRFDFSLPFWLLDTTLRFEVVGEQPAVDTTIRKGKKPGTFDTTLAPFTLVRLRAEFGPDRGPYPWMELFLDDRDGTVRRMLVPAEPAPPPADTATPPGSGDAYLTVLSDLQDAIGLRVGGHRVVYPATADGVPTGPFVSDLRYYNVEFPRKLDVEPFHGPVVAPAVDTTGDSAAAVPGA